jgi:hypothetical protein
LLLTSLCCIASFPGIFLLPFGCIFNAPEGEKEDVIAPSCITIGGLRRRFAMAFSQSFPWPPFEGMEYAIGATDAIGRAKKKMPLKMALNKIGAFPKGSS